MDSAAHSRAVSNSIIGENSNIVVPSKRDIFLSTYQPWSLPDSMIYYVLKNPSSTKVYQKLIQSCKYFFIKNSILVVSNLNQRYVKNEWKTFFNGKEIDLKNNNCKIWTTDSMGCCVRTKNVNDQHFATSLFPKIYKSDIKEIAIWHQNISFNDLVFLASKCERIDLWNVTVLDENGSAVPVEKLYEVFPFVKYYIFNFDDISATNVITSKTVQNLIAIPHFENLVYFELRTCIPECFDIETFFSYIKKNKKTRFCFRFSQNISHQYRNRLQGIVNEIIQAENRDYYIYFPGIDEFSRKKLWTLFFHE